MVRMTQQEQEYVQSSITRHINFHFHENAVASYRAADIVWIEWNDLCRHEWPEEASILIPIVPRNIVQQATWSVPFRGTTLVLWDRLPLPDGWKCDNEEFPLWYRDPQGRLMPAWDFAGTAFDLLTMQEERVSGRRDKMGRSIASMSPRHEDGRLMVPMINNSAAVLVDQCLRILQGKDALSVPFAKPVSVCLSHDLDQLRGDDFWTQAARLWRFVSPLTSFRMPDFAALMAVFANLLRPRKYFMDDLLGMMAAEQSRGFASINYVLCGTRGRFGARTSLRFITRYLREIVPQGDIGMHYNHNTLHQPDAFKRQQKQIKDLTNCMPVAGRAHYLLMDPQASFRFWEAQGIEIDESLGYPDAVGYRAGIAGPFKPFDQGSQKEASITSLPLVAMDSAIAAQFAEIYEDAIEDMVGHLSVVGGTFSLLFHPGMFVNPEHPETAGMYERLLDIFLQHNTVSKTPLVILKEMASGNEGRL